MNQPPKPALDANLPEGKPNFRPPPDSDLHAPAAYVPVNQNLSPLQIFIRILLPIAILCAGFAVLKIAGALRPAPKREVKIAGAPRVRTVAIESFEEELTLDVDGTVVPFREVSVTAEVAGRIIRKSEVCRAGKYVKEGTLLFEINPVDFELRKQQLTKQLRQAEISLHQIDVEMENYRSLIDLAMEDAQLQGDQVARLQGLVVDGASSASEVDGSRRSELGARNSLEQLKNQARLLVTRRAGQESTIDVATSQLEQAELDLKRTKITAPSDGVIVSELVQKARFVPIGTSLATIEDTSSVEVLCNLRSEHLYQLWSSRGTAARQEGRASYDLPRVPATVIYEVAGRKFAWEGRLDRYDGLGLDKSRTVPVRIVVKDPQSCRCIDDLGESAVPPALVRGMYVKVKLSVDTQTRQLARLPSRAIRPGKLIYRVENGKLKIEPIRVARITDDYAVLELDGANFAVGDRVITSPIPAPEEGMNVEISDGKSNFNSKNPATDESIDTTKIKDEAEESNDVSPLETENKAESAAEPKISAKPTVSLDASELGFQDLDLSTLDSTPSKSTPAESDDPETSR